VDILSGFRLLSSSFLPQFDPADVRGDAVLYVLPRKGDDDDGFHTANLHGIPYGFVYLDVAKSSTGTGRSPSRTKRSNWWAIRS